MQSTYNSRTALKKKNKVERPILSDFKINYEPTVIKTIRHLVLKDKWRASLVAQWLRIRLPMQGMRV